MNKDQVIELFGKAISKRNPDDVDFAVAQTFSISGQDDCVPYLCQLLEASWHYDHEDIARLLQQIRDPRSVQVLFRTATRKFDYLDYDDSKALSRKCIWALADIGNNESRDALMALTKNPDSEISQYAQKRIDNWSSEQGRKKHYT